MNQREGRNTASKRSLLITVVLLAAITLLALGLRLYHLDEQSLWYDEAFSVYLARMGLGEIAERTAADIQPPLYYLMLHGWIRLFGDGESALRSLSVLFGVLAVPLIYGVGRQLFRQRPAGLLAALLLAVSPLHIWYGQETRMYTLLIFLCLLSSYLLLLLAARRDGENRRGMVGDVGLWLAYTLTSIAALYTHYFALFILAFQAIYLLMVWWGQGFRPRRMAVGGLISGAAIGLAYLPWLPHLLTRYGADTSYWPGQLNLGQVLVDIALSFAGGETLPEQPGVLLAIVTGLIALLACLALLRQPADPELTAGRPAPAHPLPFLLLYLLLPPALILLLSYNTPKFNARYVMISQPALLLVLAGGLEALWHRARPAGRQSPAARVAYGGPAVLALCFLLGVSAYAGRGAYGDPAFARADFRDAIRYIGHHIEPDETIILTSGHMFPAFDYYAPEYGLEGKRHLLPDSPTLDTTRTLDYGIAADLNRWLAGKGGVWLLLWQDEVVDPVGYLTALLDEVGEEEPIVTRKTFPKVVLKHYRFPQGAHWAEGERPAIAHPADFNFGDKLHLLGYDQTGENQVTLFWEALGPIDEDYRVALVLRDTAGQVWGRWDGRPSSYLYPTDRWRPGQVVFGRYNLPQVPGRPPGDYGLEVGVYTEEDLGGLDVLDPSGAAQGKRAMLGAVTLPGYIASADQIEMPHPLRADLGGGLVLLGWDVDRAEAQPGDRLLLRLGWEVAAQPQGDYGLRVLVTDATGQVHDAGTFPPANAWHPTSRWQPGQGWQGQVDVRLPIQAQPGQAQLAVQLVDAGGTALGPAANLTSIGILPTDRVFAAPQPQVPREANLDGKVTLLGADLPPGPVSPGGTLSLTLYWLAQSEMDVPYSVFVRLVGTDGQVLAQQNGEPVRPTTSWVPGEFVVDAHEVALPPDLPPGSYVVEVGMYDAGARGQPRLPMLDAGGQAATDRVIFGPIRVQ